MIHWIVNLIIIGLASFLFFKRYRSDIYPMIYWAALATKWAAGLAVGWVFLYHYSGSDTFAYFEKARTLINQPFKEYLSELFTISSYEVTNRPRVLFFTKILSLFLYLSGGSYWITSLYLSFISFIASWWTVIRLRKLYPIHAGVTIFSFLFIPTVIFWSSGILKDALTSSALQVLITLTISVHKRMKFSFLEILLATLSVFILFRLKHYLLITYLLFQGILFFTDFITSSKPKVRVVAVLILFAAIGSTQLVHPYLNFKRFPKTLHENNQAIIQKTKPENQLDINIERPDWQSIIKASPSALKTGLFRPSIFDSTPSTGWPHKIENLLLAFLTIASILIWIKEKPKIDISLIVAATFSILILATLLALSTPNFGTLVRYKNAFIPFFFLLVSILPYQYFASKRPD